MIEHREEEEAPIVDGLPDGSKGIFNDQALDDLSVLQIFINLPAKASLSKSSRARSFFSGASASYRYPKTFVSKNTRIISAHGSRRETIVRHPDGILNSATRR
jgi:hypothetical protein